MKPSSKIQIDILASPIKSAHDAVLNPLLEYNAKIVGPSGKTEITFHAKDGDGQLIGGANGFTHWNYFFLAHLWVSEKQRGTGLGSHLMETIEKEAVRRGCNHCWLDTFSFQAAGFYEKLGYTRFGQLEDYPTGHQRFFYVKSLASS
jgi:GNAT superfamily N-acetyltransferase